MVLKRKQLVQGMNFYLKVLTSIPGIDNHDANSVNSSIMRQLLHISFPYFSVFPPKVAKSQDSWSYRCLKLVKVV